MKKIKSLFMLCLFGMVSIAASAEDIPNNQIWYEASSKLVETTSEYSSGLHINSFNASITSHTFSDGKGIITFDKDVTTIGKSEWIVWQGEESCSAWDGESLSFDDMAGKLPTLSDETYDRMVGKKMCLDISSVNGEGTTIRVTNTWWSKEYVPDTEVHAGDKFVFEFTEEMAYEFKWSRGGKCLLFTSNNGLTITKFYCETGAFEGCSNMKSVQIPNSVTLIENNAFDNCSGLTSIEIPKSVTSIGENAFCGCIVPSFVNNSCLNAEEHNYWGAQICDENGLVIKNNVVVDCAKWATSVTIPNTVTSIGENAFSKCSNLTSIEIPNSVEYIGYAAFEDCYSLTNVTIGNSVTEIREYAFYGCTGLKSVTVTWERPLYISDIVFLTETYYNCILYVPKGTSMMYMSAPVWINFRNIKEIGAPDPTPTICGDVNGDGVVDVADITEVARIILTGKAKEEEEVIE